MKTQAIVPVAGSGARFQASLSVPQAIPKPLILVNGKPLFVYTLEALHASSLIDSIILAVQETYLKEFAEIVRQYKLQKVSRIIPGGETRADSVFRGLQLLDSHTKFVLIHDGVRPLVSTELIDQAIKLVKQHPAVITAVPVKPTIKKVDVQNMLVQETLERDTLWEVQTPQVFHKEVILRAHEQSGEGNRATDDAVLVEKLGIPVKVLQGDYKNIKVTTQDDLVFMETLLSLKEVK
ncbi:MAG: 2-C-methyl-D-erythritol 4-phosphate cytidylyltransferase [Omnitrophica WOR_2 bacterium RIFCSPHIGHO2_01_FULL_48_9]|nr:MAG: 2-C-methyl-D-erythritol 4-phosphate cytidylyltransferase [Omnitrophica WOR_2 bacterium RIFCSPHIGHO2_02_FULL_48_11]OGX34272.1 MAG: 2-C-methyl-D-erythritol 4-phosphate cytidylyltransferase [Omnitrophica WOR_2 bacterium RIFCSPHIGHO2_01_FULL_48_9]